MIRRLKRYDPESPPSVRKRPRPTEVATRPRALPTDAEIIAAADLIGWGDAKALARHLGVETYPLYQRLRKLKRAPADLGRVPDRDVARRMKVSVERVTWWRRQRGIPAWIDTEYARKHGITVEAAYRKRLGAEPNVDSVAPAAKLGRKGKIPYPLPPKLTLPVITWADWVAAPSQPKDKARWQLPLVVYRTDENLSFRVTKADSDWIVVRLFQGRRRVGGISIQAARRAGEMTWVVVQSHLDDDLQRRGLGSLMYLVGHAVVEAYRGDAKMVSSADWIGSGTSPQAQAVWKRLRAWGRLNWRLR